MNTETIHIDIICIFTIWHMAQVGNGLLLAILTVWPDFYLVMDFYWYDQNQCTKTSPSSVDCSRRTFTSVNSGEVG